MTHEEAMKPLDSAIWEMSEVFDGLKDEDVWVRAHPRLLSLGELAAHVAYGESKYFLGGSEGPLISEDLSYYPVTIKSPVVLSISAEDLYKEVKRIHESCRDWFLANRPDLNAKCPHRDEWTWAYTLEYMAFHIAYHTGQMYSVRHLMGHETNNN